MQLIYDSDMQSKAISVYKQGRNNHQENVDICGICCTNLYSNGNDVISTLRLLLPAAAAAAAAVEKVICQ